MKIKCIGRFSKGSRTSRRLFKYGALSLSNEETPIDYASSGVTLSHGYTNIKV